MIRTFFALFPLMLALPFGMDIYVPAVPHITTVFNTTDALMQATLNLFMLTTGIMQLWIGPYSDSIGRIRPTLLCNLSFAIGCIICALSHNITTLIIGRVIQAAGAGGLIVLGNAIARDLYTGNLLAKLYSGLNGVIAFAPLFAPFIGAYLDVYFGWQSTFLILLLIPVLVMIVYIPSLGETLSIAKRTPLDKKLFTIYFSLLKNKTFRYYAYSGSFGMLYFYIFCTISPIIILTKLQLPELDYGFYFAYMGASFMLGSILSGLIVERVSIYWTCLLGYCISLTGGVWAYLWHFNYGLEINGFVYPMVLMGTGGVFNLAAGSAGAMSPFGHISGYASALSSSMRFLFAGIIGLIIANHIENTLPLSLSAIVFSFIGITQFIIYRQHLQV